MTLFPKKENDELSVNVRPKIRLEKTDGLILTQGKSIIILDMEQVKELQKYIGEL